MQKAVRKYLKALEAGNAAEAAELFTKDGWVRSPFLGLAPEGREPGGVRLCRCVQF